MGEGRGRFSLQDMLVGVAIVALPLSQYPFVRFVRTSWRTHVEFADPDTFRLSQEDVEGYYLPTWQFAVALAVSGFVIFAWYVWRRKRKQSPVRMPPGAS